MRLPWPSWAVPAVLGLWLVSPTPAYAFKIKSHVYTANTAMEDIRDGEAYFPGLTRLHHLDSVGRPAFEAWEAPDAECDPDDATLCADFDDFCGDELGCTLDGGWELALDHPDLVTALNHYPDHARAGAVGPDGFPDLIWGQQSAHVHWVAEEEGDLPVSSLPADLPFECRDPNNPFAWRSIDYATYMLDRALKYCPGGPESDGTCAHPAHFQALAFAWGYLVHVSGDSFAHAWVNQQVGGRFAISVGEGLFGPATEEVKHLALEGYVDEHYSAQVFEDTAYTNHVAGVGFAANTDPKMPGNNAVVYPEILDGTDYVCPDPLPARWRYCNPFRDADGNATAASLAAPDFEACDEASENPWAGSCDPWQEVCDPAANTAGFEATIAEIESCPDNEAFPEESWSSGDEDLSAWDDLDLCDIKWAIEAMVALPETCDPTKTSVVHVMGTDHVVNECIAINCNAHPDQCPDFGIQGVADPLAGDQGCVSTIDTTIEAVQARLGEVGARVPVDFLRWAYFGDEADGPAQIDFDGAYPMPEQPASDTYAGRYPRSMGLGGPHLHAAMVLRDRFETLAYTLRFVVFDVSLLADVINEELIQTSKLPWWLKDGIGGFIGAVTTIESIFDETLANLTCELSFGLLCPDFQPPILAPSNLFTTRAAFLDGELLRWLQLSECNVGNLLERARLDEDDATRGSAITDQCLEHPWFVEMESPWASSGYDGLAGLVQPLALWLDEEVGDPPGLEECLGFEFGSADPGSVGTAVKRMKGFVTDHTLSNLMLHPEEFGLGGTWDEIAKIGVDLLLYSLVGETTETLTAKQLNFLCRTFIAPAIGDMEAVVAVLDLLELMGDKSAALMVNLAFLADDVERDPAWAAAVESVVDPADYAALTDRDQLEQLSADDASEMLLRVVTDLENGGALLSTGQGPKLREMNRLLHLDPPLSSTAPNLVVTRFPPLYNAVQLNKLAAFSASGLGQLATQADRLPAWALRGVVVSSSDLTGHHPPTLGANERGPFIPGSNPLDGDEAVPAMLDVFLADDGARHQLYGDGIATLPGLIGPPANSAELTAACEAALRDGSGEDRGFCPFARGNVLCGGVPSLDNPDDVAHHEWSLASGSFVSLIPRTTTTEPVLTASAAPECLLRSGLQKTACNLRSTTLDRIVDAWRIPGSATTFGPEDDLAPLGANGTLNASVLPSSGTRLVYARNSFLLASAHSPSSGYPHPNVTRVYANVFAPWYCHVEIEDPADSPARLTDSDDDTVIDACDRCPFVPDPGQEDTNQDGIGDACDGDLDGVTDDQDTCPYTYDPDQDGSVCAELPVCEEPDCGCGVSLSATGRSVGVALVLLVTAWRRSGRRSPPRPTSHNARSAAPPR